MLDIWSQIFLLDQGERLGKYITHYRERYFVPDKRNQHIVYSWRLKPGASTIINSKISDICVSMSAKDWLDLPERINNVIKIPLPNKAREKYKQLEKELLLPFTNSDVVADTAAILSNKLLQMANGAVYDENKAVQVIHDEKLNALEDVVEAVNGKPILIFYSYRHDLQRIQQRFPTAREIRDGEILRLGTMEMLRFY